MKTARGAQLTRPPNQHEHNGTGGEQQKSLIHDKLQHQMMVSSN